jgi:hypothetical protein
VALEQELEDRPDPGVIDLVELAVRGVDVAEEGFGARAVERGERARIRAAPGTQSASGSAFVNSRSVAILRLLSALAASPGSARAFPGVVPAAEKGPRLRDASQLRPQRSHGKENVDFGMKPGSV